ncbi:methyltransferase [Bradyrhizobium sp. JYMT SZCCT0180]|uniref:methyltransferase family protein n=1 Tax=Bradyrhizobium sp. JYMT SZCCT0180 TaxID=2807666 RepID=UPI001BA8069A|nr:methyltransferase [Bradyrhizobium sp. JYMT SZCCT0180]MBR1210292.1 protein-S-isoprenylcysteine methyltransferase [Bradyrhizobium sp. JYMT SZCCT0180]
MSTITLSKNWSYERTMQLLGAMWFMMLALLVATKIGTSLGDPWPSLLSSFCLGIFYVLLTILMLTRPPAKAHATGVLPRIAAFVGSYMPWTITFFGKTEESLPNLLSTACVLIGMIMMLVTIRHLGKSFSLVPQARRVVQTGPYRWIKHPLYLAEEIVILGVVLQYLTVTTVIILFLHIGVQICRILYEEDLLRRSLPEYSSYEATRWRLIPYVW